MILLTDCDFLRQDVGNWTACMQGLYSWRPWAILRARPWRRRTLVTRHSIPLRLSYIPSTALSSMCSTALLLLAQGILLQLRRLQQPTLRIPGTLPRLRQLARPVRLISKSLIPTNPLPLRNPSHSSSLWSLCPGERLTPTASQPRMKPSQTMTHATLIHLSTTRLSKNPHPQSILHIKRA